MTIKKNCLNCDNAYWKKLTEAEAEQVLICEKDNHYIGYPDEADKETCEQHEIVN